MITEEQKAKLKVLAIQRLDSLDRLALENGQSIVKNYWAKAEGALLPEMVTITIHPEDVE